MAADNLHLVADLAMRARELTLFHEVTRILQRDDLTSVTGWLEQITKAIQRLRPHPGAIGARSRLGNVEAATAGLEPAATAGPETAPTTSPEPLTLMYLAEFAVADGRTGAIEVRCARGESGAREDPALGALL